MSVYSQMEIQAIRQSLERQREELIAQVRAVLSESEQNQFSAILGRSAGDSSDEALATSLADLSAARLNLDIRRLRELEAAAGRMDNPDFGVCPDCGVPISPARLVANPAALRCVACQETHEKTHAGQPHGSL